MSGKWNRRSSDNCSYQQEVMESTGPISYMLFSGKYRNCGLCTAKNECCSDDGLKKEHTATHGGRIELENDLFNIQHLSSKCNDLKYIPRKNTPVAPLHRNPQPCYNWSNGLPQTKTTGYKLPTNNCINK